MKLIVITVETFLEREAEAVNLLFENGLEVLHFRKPCASPYETKSFIKQIKTDFHSRMVLHDCYELTELFDLKGIHLNRRNRDMFMNKPLCGERRLSISRSCHSLEEVVEARFCDYVFLSPVFDSVSKIGYKQAFTPRQLEDAKERGIIDESVMALGGITAENIPVAHRYGFGGVAVLGSLWNGFAADGNVNELLERFNELKNITETL